MCKLMLMLALASSTMLAKAVKAEESILVVDDGAAIIEKGIFEPGCFYGDSLSDHAPVIYGGFGTWNIASPLNHFLIKPPNEPQRTFYNHKFFTDDKGNLVDKNGSLVGFLSTSEVALFTPKGKRGYAVVSQHYINRINKIALAISKMFKERKSLQHMVLQEIPGSTEKTMAGENLQALIKEAFLVADKQLNIIFFSIPKEKDNYLEMPASPLPTLSKRNNVIDVAIVSKNKLKQEISDHYNRMVPYCDVSKKICYVSAHMPFTETDADLEGRCKLIHDHVIKLFDSGYSRIKIAGDFNTNAKRVATICKNALVIPDATVKIHTSKGGLGSSCSSNKGDTTSFNIDILIEFSKIQGKK